VEACPSGARELCGRTLSPEQLLAEAERDRPFYDESGGGVTFSGGEPLTQPEFLIECLDRLGSVEIHRALDTCGFGDSRTLMEVAGRTDLFLYDLKHMDPERHRIYVGVDNALILENLTSLSGAGARIWVRIPLIPGINDDPENLDATARFVAALPNPVEKVCLLPYHASGRGKYDRWGMEYRLGDLLPPTEHQLRQAALRLERHGLTVQRGG
jgi:pyruvate formate lyase activating enzyme